MPRKFGMHPVRTEDARLAQEPSSNEKSTDRLSSQNPKTGRVLRPAQEPPSAEDVSLKESAKVRYLLLRRQAEKEIPAVPPCAGGFVLEPRPTLPFKERKPPEQIKPGTRMVDRPLKAPYAWSYDGRPVFGRGHGSRKG